MRVGLILDDTARITICLDSEFFSTPPEVSSLLGQQVSARFLSTPIMVRYTSVFTTQPVSSSISSADATAPAPSHQADISVALRSATSSLRGIAHSVAEIAGTQNDERALYVQVVLAVLTLLAVGAAAWAAWQAARTARATELMAGDAQLRDLQQEFESRHYVLRFWYLQHWISDSGIGFWSLDPSQIPANAPAHVQSILKCALGQDCNAMRYDMLTLYDFALRLDAWLKRYPKGFQSNRNVSYINDCFGRELVGTFLRHRLVACVLKKHGGDKQYFPRHAGLFDETYETLVDALFDDLRSRRRIPESWERLWLEFDTSVNSYVHELRSEQQASRPV